HSGVFTRIDVTDQMIVGGGQDSDSLPFANTGGRWKRSTNSWTATTTTSAPSGRQGQPAVWTGHGIIVWGGDAGTDLFLNPGGRYNPGGDVWRPTTLTGAPTGRFGHSLVWTGDRAIVWGGPAGFVGGAKTGGPDDPFPATRESRTDCGGGKNPAAPYDPFTDPWTATTTVGAPSARTGQAAIWTGSQMLVWG